MCEGKYYSVFWQFWSWAHSKEIEQFIGNKNITTIIYRIQSYDSIMCGYLCTGFIDFLLKGKSLLDYKNLFSPSDYEKSHKTIQKHFQ